MCLRLCLYRFLCKSNFRAYDFFLNFFVTIKICFMRRAVLVCRYVSVSVFFIFKILEIAHRNRPVLSVYVCMFFFGNNQFFTSKGQFATIHSKIIVVVAHCSHFFSFSVSFQIMNFNICVCVCWYCFSHIPKYIFFLVQFLLLKHNQNEEKKNRSFAH